MYAPFSARMQGRYAFVHLISTLSIDGSFFFKSHLVLKEVTLKKDMLFI